MHRLTLIVSLVTVGLLNTQTTSAQSDLEVETERTGLVYSIGRVEKVINGAALIDMGDVHTLSIAPPLNQVALFRNTDDRYVPIGVLRIAETHQTFSLTYPAAGVIAEPGDVVMYVRELSELKSPNNHLDSYVRQQLVKTRNKPGFTTFRQEETAIAIRNYQDQYPRWERSRASVIGFLNGRSYMDGREKTLKPLLDYIGMVREDYRIGRNSLSAAGREWQSTVQVLFGKTVMAQHEAAQVDEVDDPIFADSQRPPDRDIRREINERLFDRTPEERNVLAYVIATLLEHTPRNQDAWYQQTILRTQFPELGDEEFVIDKVSAILKALQENQ